MIHPDTLKATDLDLDTTWTLFNDMHSGGGTKVESFENILIEGERAEAIDKFEELFDQKPFDVACDCCGENYVVSTEPTFDLATEYARRWYGSSSLEEYINQPNVLVIPNTNQS